MIFSELGRYGRVIIVFIQPSVIIQTDASNVGWGAVMNEVFVGVLGYNQKKQNYHIHVVELIT